MSDYYNGELKIVPNSTGIDIRIDSNTNRAGTGTRWIKNEAEALLIIERLKAAIDLVWGQNSNEAPQEPATEPEEA